MANNSSAKGAKPRGPPPALNPESCALVQPYKDFVGKGFISKITVEFSPMGNTVHCCVKDSLLKSGETKDSIIAIGDAKLRIIDAKLWTPKEKGGKAKDGDSNAFVSPKKSLCKEDFSLNKEQLSKRVLEVSKALGDTVARGRIGSLKLMIDGAATFDDWWKGAAPAEKTRLLSDKKHHDTFSEADHLLIGGLVSKSPFRGVVPVPSKEDEDSDDPEEQKTTYHQLGALVKVPKKGKGGSAR